MRSVRLRYIVVAAALTRGMSSKRISVFDRLGPGGDNLAASQQFSPPQPGVSGSHRHFDKVAEKPRHGLPRGEEGRRDRKTRLSIPSLLCICGHFQSGATFTVSIFVPLSQKDLEEKGLHYRDSTASTSTPHLVRCHASDGKELKRKSQSTRGSEGV